MLASKSGLIDIYPDFIWSSRMMKPIGRVGVRGFILNNAVRAVIHEMVHQSGVHDEGEAKALTKQLYEEFRWTYLSRFDKEFKPLLKEWRGTERELGLR